MGRDPFDQNFRTEFPWLRAGEWTATSCRSPSIPLSRRISRSFLTDGGSLLFVFELVEDFKFINDIMDDDDDIAVFSAVSCFMRRNLTRISLSGYFEQTIPAQLFACEFRPVCLLLFSISFCFVSIFFHFLKHWSPVTTRSERRLNSSAILSKTTFLGVVRRSKKAFEFVITIGHSCRLDVRAHDWIDL